MLGDPVREFMGHTTLVFSITKHTKNIPLCFPSCTFVPLVVNDFPVCMI